MQVAAGGLGCKAGAQFTVGGDSAGDEDTGRSECFLRGEGLAEQVADDGVLKAGDKVESLRISGGEGILNGRFGRSVGASEKSFATGFSFGAQVVEFDVSKDRRFDARKRKEKVRIKVGNRGGFCGFGAGRLSSKVGFGFDLRKGKWNGLRVAVLGECVDPRSTGIAESQEFGDLVVGLTGGVVDSTAYERVAPCAVGWTGEVEMGVSAGDDEGQGGVFRIRGAAIIVEELLLLTLVEKDGMNVAFKVVDGDERKILRVGQRFGIGDADEQRSGKARAGGDGDGVEVVEGDLRLFDRRAHDRDDGAEMFAAGKFRDHPAVSRVSGDLRCDY